MSLGGLFFLRGDTERVDLGRGEVGAERLGGGEGEASVLGYNI